MDSLLNFFDHPFFVLLGGASAVLLVIGTFYKVVTWFFGITPIILRFGFALQSKRVAIFGSSDAHASLRAALIDSGIFKDKNIVAIDNSDLVKGKSCHLFLVDWESCGELIDEVFSLRQNHQTAVVIIAKPATIPQNKISEIANRSNTVIVNFKGRLLNDMLTSLVTTSYDR